MNATLREAVFGGNAEQVAGSLDGGADPNHSFETTMGFHSTSNGGYGLAAVVPVLTLAAITGRADVVGALLRAGADRCKALEVTVTDDTSQGTTSYQTEGPCWIWIKGWPEEQCEKSMHACRATSGNHGMLLCVCRRWQLKDSPLRRGDDAATALEKLEPLSPGQGACLKLLQ